ncbi:MAG: hypothetical protein AAGI48_01425 [Verrucomicrobiota bacterium]
MSDGDWKGTKRTVRGGMEVRVIGAGMGDPRVGKFERSRQSLGGAVEEVDGGTEQGDEVVRLEDEAIPLAKRKLEDQERSESAPPRRSRKKRRFGLGILTVLMATAAILLSVAGVAVVMTLDQGNNGDETFLENLRVVDGEEIDPEIAELGLSQSELDDLMARVRVLVTNYTQANSFSEVVPLVRNGEDLESLLNERWKPLQLALDGWDGLKGSADRIAGRVVVSLAGRDREAEPFALLIVEEGEELLVDWEASFGMGEVLFEDLSGVPIGSTVKLRAMVEGSNFHPLEFPDDRYRCYRLRDREDVHPIFGYVEIGSDEHQKLTELVNDGSMLIKSEENIPVILKVKNTGQGSSGQFKITRVIQKGWVEP